MQLLTRGGRAGALALVACTAFVLEADAQTTTQVRPRVMLMVDTSGSMAFHLDDDRSTGGDGTYSYSDAVMSRSQAVDGNYGLYVGFELNGPTCPSTASTTFDGKNSRMAAAKAAIMNVLNASGDIDWGLMRYSGNQCTALSATDSVDPVPTLPAVPLPKNRCYQNSDCPSNSCDTTNHECHCSSNAQCGANTTCTSTNINNGYCTCANSATNCGTNQRCDAQGTRYRCGCNNDTFCAGGFDCGGNGAGRLCQCQDSQCGDNGCASQNPPACDTPPTCTNDGQCGLGEFCIGGYCRLDKNLCWRATTGGNNNADVYGFTDTRDGNTCGYLQQQYANGAMGYPNQGVYTSYSGTCGTSATGGVGTACATVQSCNQDSDCSGTATGRCALIGAGPAKACRCNATGTSCPTNYTCDNGQGRCVYSLACISEGGTVLVDPSATGFANTQVTPWVDGVEDYHDAGGGKPTNPELHALAGTPLAGAARSATNWYKSVIASDPKAQCRPYVLVQLTDGADGCDNSNTAGPVAAVQGFVAATTANAKNLNKVYVIGLAFGGAANTTLDQMAVAGGTGTARYANSQADIEAALADIVASSVLVEKCNNADDDCDGVCDNGFPDVGITATNGCTVRAAKTCDNGQLAGTHCFATGSYACSTDQLSQVCNAPTCATNSALCPVGENAVTGNKCNNVDDDCNGVVDDCTPFVPNSCCTSACPACAAGGPFPETCDGCDNDCDGTIDNHLTDTGLGCGSGLGLCEPGQTYCCQETNPTTTACTRSTATSGNPDRLVCLGGRGPATEACNGADDDCNGVTDEVSRACYTGAAATRNVGICRDGVEQCTGTACGTAPNACCPTPITAGEACPGAATYGACTGQVLPTTESCNGLDDNCDGTVDNGITYTPSACCSTGNDADCANSGGATRCKAGAFQCVGGTKSCVGSVAKSVESCNQTDDDCNGTVDDVAGIGAACTHSGILTVGACKAAYQCLATAGDGPNQLTCVQTVGPVAETCNGIDDNCDGTVDNGTLPGVGATCGQTCGALPAAQCRCKTGTNQCSNGTLTCTGAVGPINELCNGIDDNCDGSIDNAVTDPWAGQSCCPSGNLADCQNTGAGSRCKVGTYTCSSGAQTCTGAVQKGVETCNGIDDDCDGIVDNVPGLNTACTGDGTNTTGACTAQWKCTGTFHTGGLNGMTCTQVVSPTTETCNGVDDNCNGTVDDSPTGVGVACGQNCPGGTAAGCKGACKAGTTACTNGALTCSGSTGPSTETCNGIDDDCNGTIDDNLSEGWVNQACCSTGNNADCTNTGGATRCATGTYKCQAGARVCDGSVAKTTESCNSIDDNCNGIIDDVTGKGTSCTDPSNPALKNLGICTTVYACAASPGNGPNGLTCVQGVGPTTEVCNGLDDNCDGQVDVGATDVGGSCGANCPGGNVANCVGRCTAGSIVCQNGAKVCSGSVGPIAETCNNVDDDCNGVKDDVPGLGTSCSSGGVNTQGVCTARYVCDPANPGPAPSLLTCRQDVGPSSELCNGLDDNCDGQVDNNPSDVGGACGQECPGGDVTKCVGVCKAGTTQCVNGAKVCSGSSGGTDETCNGLDDNCDGQIDNGLKDSWLGQSCCPTGNPADCTNTGASTRCQLGAYKCQAGGRVCDGGVAKGTEICNGIDDDCNGIVDDVPGIGAACSGGGVKTLGPCTAHFVCNGTSGTGPNGLTCQQDVGPTPELCNGIDDDCDGTTDNNLQDSRIGVQGGSPCLPLPAGQMQPPCDPGITVCRQGAVVCDGEVLPQPNQCNGISTDCTGQPNTNGNCPSGYECFQGNCVTHCGVGEFPCPGGFVCEPTKNVCIPDKCQQANCGQGFLCEIQPDGSAVCVDPCANVTCPSGYLCKLGTCEDASCKTQGCPAGQKCVGTPPMCETDLCAGVLCSGLQFCDPQTGQCTDPCTMCGKGEICVSGECQPDPCNGVTCPSGETCSAMNGVGTCIEDQCAAGCNPGLLCCQGMCLNDPCQGVECPNGSTCTVDDGCNPTCPAGPKDQIAAGGGGGYGPGCSMAQGSASGSENASGLLFTLFAVAAGLLARRRGRSLLGEGYSNRLLALLVFVVGGLSAGCGYDPFCLNCNSQPVDAGPASYADLSVLPDLTPPVDLTPVPDLLVLDKDGMPCQPSNAGIEICDGIDNDCNGTVDDVDPKKLEGDPNHCGSCANKCDYTALHQFGACVGGGDGGTPTCAPAECVFGFVDVDPNVPGCEYACTPSTDPTEVCDGRDNDCNGVIDDPFGYPTYDKDPNNCGACASVCNLPGAVSKCVPDGNNGGQGLCAVDHCINDGADTYRHQSTVPGELNTTGCEYHCPEPSTTVTSGSDDCDTVSCSFAAEVCDGIDNDCNFLSDDDPTDVGAPCADKCPGGDLARCVGQCAAGVVTCTAGVRQCLGSKGPGPELCDGIDNDCSGTADDNLSEGWINQDCCPTGKLADCTNTGGATRCQAGKFQCSSGAKVCTGGVTKEPESCDGVDNDCNGAPDNVPGIGTDCSDGVNTTGQCAAAWACLATKGSGPNGLTCQATVTAKQEECNGLDDDCDGVVDNAPTGVGVACGQNCPGGTVAGCKGACVAGAMQCQNGGLACVGSTGPTSESCNGVDDDCNGVKDDVPGIGTACTGSNVNTKGICTAAYACTGSNGGGPNGLSCQQVVGPGAESCNGLDDDCDGTVDNNVPTVGNACGQNCRGGTLAGCVGHCQAGTISCANGALSCVGSVGPIDETCNGVDDNCNGAVDDSPTDPWINTACCPTGNLADCQNTGAGSRCQAGHYTCSAGGKVCTGGTAKGVETCNGIDDDCDGIVDNVPGINTACNVGGVNTTGACTAQWKCTGTPNPTGMNGLTCTQVVGPAAQETCNGIDDNCNGTVDESPTGVGVACGTNCPGGAVVGCRGECHAGTTACTNGALVCNGSTGPSAEVCDGKDNDCNGNTDDSVTDTWLNQACCSTGNNADCTNTGTGTRCHTGTYVCGAGGVRTCSNSVAKSSETCDSADNDCNGAVDDIAAINTPCTGGTANTTGACTAQWKCTGSDGGGPSGLTCTQVIGPKSETCNGADDDCNGTIDDNTTDTGAACGQSCPGGATANCVGECKAGTITCSGGVKVCTGSTGPAPEVCDGKDNDCNGTIDDGFGYPKYDSDPKNCGACGNTCGLANAVNGCHSDTAIDSSGKGVCYVIACNQNATDGYNYLPSSPCGSTPRRDGPGGVGCNYKCPVWPKTTEVCDGKDNDCNGQVDELKSANPTCFPSGLVPPALCSTVGVCGTTTNTTTCGGASGWKCTYGAGVETDTNGNLRFTEAVCDDKDGNCNGVTDLDGFPQKGQACTAGTGVCQSAGTQVCKADKTGTQCSVSAQPNNAVDEICDGKDNNCDGQIDERTPNGTLTCYNGGSHTCKGYVEPMVKIGTSNLWVYSYEATRPDATASSPGANSSRACSNAGVLPWNNVTQAQAAAACAAIKDSNGSPMRLCTTAEWQQACEGPTPVATGDHWSMSTTPTTWAAGVCNDYYYNSANPAEWVTGTVPSGAPRACYTDWAAAGKLYDMSGNLAEWTSTSFTSGGSTYYRYRGGAYNVPQGGTTCEFNFPAGTVTYANADVGFRCCADHAP